MLSVIGLPTYLGTYYSFLKVVNQTRPPPPAAAAAAAAVVVMALCNRRQLYKQMKRSASFKRTLPLHLPNITRYSSLFYSHSLQRTLTVGGCINVQL